MNGTTFTIRPVENGDSEQLIELVGKCFAEYPGCVLDVDREEPELRAPADHFEWMVVAVQDDRVVGMIGSKLGRSADGEPAIELKKLYIDPEARGSGLARVLVDRVEQRGRDEGVAVVDLWSDTRFDKAHAVYEHFGYRRQPRVRDLHDLSNTREFYFKKRL